MPAQRSEPGPSPKPARVTQDEPRIRPIAVGLAVRDGHVLVLDGADARSGDRFHRAIGGGIEFGEPAADALRREWREELAVEIETTTLLGVTENIFDFEGHPGHEIVFVYDVGGPEIDAIGLDEHRRILDEGSPVGWRPIDALDRPLYPDGCEAFARAIATGRAT